MRIGPQKKFQSDSVHVAPLETAGIITVEMIQYSGQMSHGKWGPLLGVVGVSVWGLVLVVVGFCSVGNAWFYELGLTRDSQVIPGLTVVSVLSTSNLGLNWD